MADKTIDQMTIKELTNKLASINKEREAIIKLIQDAAKAVGVAVEQKAPASKSVTTKRKAKGTRKGKTSNKDAVQSILADGKTLPTKELVQAIIAQTGGKESSARQFLYSPPGKKLVVLKDNAWKLK